MPEQSQWFVYMIETNKRNYYTGITTDVVRRWNEHLSGKGAKYFRLNKPTRLLFVEKLSDRSQASKREYEIKQLTRKKKESLVLSKSNMVSDVAPELM